MSVTAARLGTSPITVDWSSLPKGGPAANSAAFAAAWSKLKERFDKDEVGFFRAPSEDRLSQMEASNAAAGRIRESSRFTDCLFLGIGGSALGPLAMISALQDRRAGDTLRFHFLQNTDPHEWLSTVQDLAPARTFVVVVTKSGTTFETLAQLTLALDWLGRDRWKTHVIAITDPEKGDLLQFARAQGVPTLQIAPSIGGRFSVFSPVGLFPMALAGLDTRAFLQGANLVREYVEKQPHEKNPLFILGSELIRLFPKRSVHICMPYSTRLRDFAQWVTQLWAESLGKDGKGFTPVAAQGATDQHSILQLLRDGPDDKVTTFITIDRVQDEVALPKPLRGLESERLAAFRVLENHSLQELLMVEYRATSLVLTRRERPHFTLQLDRLDEKSIGALSFSYCVLTAVTGALWGVNPFDQPGVEEGKVYIRESLRHPETL